MPNVRREADGDRAAIRNVIIDAFAGTAEADLVDALRRSGELVVSLVAEDGGTIVGHVALSRLKAPANALALAPVSVLGSRQGRGIGSVLIRRALDAASDGGDEVVFVLGEPAYYGRFGFSAHAAAPFPSPYAGPYFMAQWLTEARREPGPVVYPDAFDALG